MASGANVPDLTRRAAPSVGHIRTGAKPADRPVAQGTPCALDIHVKTARYKRWLSSGSNWKTK